MDMEITEKYKISKMKIQKERIGVYINIFKTQQESCCAKYRVAY